MMKRDNMIPNIGQPWNFRRHCNGPGANVGQAKHCAALVNVLIKMGRLFVTSIVFIIT